MHIMRAEKGFVMIGDETDGTVIPQDLGLDWAISKKKSDYLGKRAQERSFLSDPERWKLVGLETIDGSVLPDGAYAVADGSNANGQRHMIGRVTSTYHSPTLDRGIAMGLVQRGPDRMQAAADETPGTMAAVLGLDDDKVDLACRKTDGEVWVANYNAPGQVVIAGEVDGDLPEGWPGGQGVAGAKRVMPIKVGGAFHTPFMSPARDRLRKTLSETETSGTANRPVFANIDADPLHRTPRIGPASSEPS